MDPLGHCQDAAVYFPDNLVEGRTLLSLFQAFEVFDSPLGGVVRDVEDVTFYVMGPTDINATGNYWTSLPDWPAFSDLSLYLHDSASLVAEAGVADPEQDVQSQTTSYFADPSDPIPSQGGNNLNLPCGPLDQVRVSFNLHQCRPSQK